MYAHTYNVCNHLTVQDLRSNIIVADALFVGFNQA